MMKYIHNPVSIRLSKRAGCLSGYGAAVLCLLFGFMLAIYVFSAELLASGPVERTWWVYLLALIVIASSLVFLPYVAANLTITYRRSLEYPLLSTTTLSSLKIVQGLVWGTIHRCRVLLGVSLGFVPFGVPFIRSGFPPGIVYDGFLGPLSAGWFGVIFKYGLVVLAAGLALVSFTLLSVSFGVALGLWWPIKPLVISAAIFLPLAIAYVAVNMVSYGVDSWTIQDFFLADMIKIIFTLLIFSMLALGILWLAQHWARFN
jgi:hypothetical protein